MQDHGLIKNLRQFLLKESPFSSKLSGIFTAVPFQTPYPYLTLEWENTLQQRGRASVTVTLKLWSAYQGLKEIKELGSELKKILEAPHIGIPLENTQESLQLRSIQENLKADAKGLHCFALTYTAFLKEKREKSHVL